LWAAGGGKGDAMKHAATCHHCGDVLGRPTWHFCGRGEVRIYCSASCCSAGSGSMGPIEDVEAPTISGLALSKTENL